MTRRTERELGFGWTDETTERPDHDRLAGGELGLETQTDVAHLLLELRATLAELPSSRAAERARALLETLLERELGGPGSRESAPPL
jgi:hypothetical protein